MTVEICSNVGLRNQSGVNKLQTSYCALVINYRLQSTEIDNEHLTEAF